MTAERTQVVESKSKTYWVSGLIQIPVNRFLSDSLMCVPFEEVTMQLQ